MIPQSVFETRFVGRCFKTYMLNFFEKINNNNVYTLVLEKKTSSSRYTLAFWLTT